MPRLRARASYRLEIVDVALDVLVEPASHDEDRVAYVARRDALTLLIADGAGNSGRGAAAAERAIAAVHDTVEPASTIVRLDRALAELGGEAAVLVATIVAHEQKLALQAAAAGDIRAWARIDDAWHELTRSVPRKPLVGSGARPYELGALGASAIVVATDGLAALADLPRDWPPDGRLEVLLDAVRLPGGTLVDDTSVLRARTG